MKFRKANCNHGGTRIENPGGRVAQYVKIPGGGVKAFRTKLRVAVLYPLLPPVYIYACNMAWPCLDTTKLQNVQEIWEASPYNKS